MHFDTIIVGGGPAGLTAAQVLGRCRRSVLVVDAGHPRNYAARHLHNFLSRDGVEPAELLEIGRRELELYGVAFRKGSATNVVCEDDSFSVEVDGEPCASSRTLLLATGVTDELPAITNFRELYGRGVHHCPYCDGWEYRDQPLAAYGDGSAGVGLALNLLTWSRDVTVVTNGSDVEKKDAEKAARFGIRIRMEKIVRLEMKPGDVDDDEPALESVVFESGEPLRVAALFFNTDQFQRSQFPARLGCSIDKDGSVLHDDRQRTGVDGLYLAGDASHDVQFVIVAAAEGAKAGVAINADLQERDREAHLKTLRGRRAD